MHLKLLRNSATGVKDVVSLPHQGRQQRPKGQQPSLMDANHEEHDNAFQLALTDGGRHLSVPATALTRSSKLFRGQGPAASQNARSQLQLALMNDSSRGGQLSRATTFVDGQDDEARSSDDTRTAGCSSLWFLYV